MAWRGALRRLAVGGAAAATIGLGGVTYCEASGPIFDPEALERGAKALREINKSPNAKQVIELSRQQEVTKQQDAKTKQAEFEAYAKQAAVEQEKVRWEEQRKAIQDQAAYNKQTADYQAELRRRQIEVEHEKERERNRELVLLQQQSARQMEAEKRQVAEQIEAERRATERYKAELEKGIQREKALAEAEGRTRENRENEDINRRNLQLQLEEGRRQAIDSINAVFSNLGSAATDLLTDQRKLSAAILGLSLAAIGYFSAKEGTRVAGKAIDRWLGTPKLVRDTSRRHWWQRRPAGAEKTLEDVKRDFSDIVLPRALQDHVRGLAAITANTKAHGAPFRHMLFYGPPGTGKSMAAKRLAHTAGLDYAIMSGGDVAPLGGGAVSQLHDMFDWAERSRRGLLLFIDEADAFLSRRGQPGQQMSEGLRAALNAMLFRTGDQSRDFILVLATNRPSDLDPAVIDRMDEALEFPLPGPAERRRILQIYLDRYIARAGTSEGGAATGAESGLGARLRGMLRGRKTISDRIKMTGIDDALLSEAVSATEGFSGRELAKLVASMQAAVYGTREATLTPDIFRSVLAMKTREHSQRRQFMGSDAP